MQQDPEFWRKCFEDAVQRIERNANSLKILGQIIERCLLSSRIFFRYFGADGVPHRRPNCNLTLSAPGFSGTFVVIAS